LCFFYFFFFFFFFFFFGTASDYYGSDLDENADTATPASANRRKHRASVAVQRMAEYFSIHYPISAQNIFASYNGLPPHWMARLRRYNREEGRWVEKGPVVLMILPCRKEPGEGGRGGEWEARLVAHFAFGTQSAVINMPSECMLLLYFNIVHVVFLHEVLGITVVTNFFFTKILFFHLIL
jgi:hypothetical protein